MLNRDQKIRLLEVAAKLSGEIKEFVEFEDIYQKLVDKVDGGGIEKEVRQINTDDPEPELGRPGLIPASRIVKGK